MTVVTPRFVVPAECPCGDPATTRVEVEWAGGVKRSYRYCEDCANDVAFSIEGAEIVP